MASSGYMMYKYRISSLKAQHACVRVQPDPRSKGEGNGFVSCRAQGFVIKSRLLGYQLGSVDAVNFEVRTTRLCYIQKLDARARCMHAQGLNSTIQLNSHSSRG
jgi:hypothetical protein